jgi:phytoene dehydrogenase-like protein
MNTLLNTIVIGSDLSSLTAALVSANHGKSTALIIERDFPASFSEKGYVFDTRNMTFGGVNPDGMLRHLLKVLDISLPEHTRTPPPLQVILPDHRITLFNDSDLLAKEIEREFGISWKNIQNLYDKALPEIESLLSPEAKGGTLPGTRKPFQLLLLALRKIVWRKIIFPLNFYKLKESSALVDTFRSLSAVLANVDTDKIDPLSLSYAFLVLSKAIHLDCVDNRMLIENMREKFESLGGHVVKDCDIKKVSLGSPLSVEVKIGDDVFIIDGESIITSAKWNKLAPSVLDDKRLSGLLRKYRKRESSFLYPFTFFMGVQERGIPEMMSENVIFLADKSQHFLKGNLLIITRCPRGDTAHAPEERCALSITMFLEDPPRRLNDSVLHHLIHNSLNTLGGFLPFLRENIDFIATDNSLTLSREYQDVMNRKIHVKKGTSSETPILSNRRKLKNIIITGGEFLPALGIEGEIISGIEAAERTIEWLGR